MNEPAQAVAEQQYPISQADQVDEILTHMFRDGEANIEYCLNPQAVNMIRKYVVRLQRQAAKSNNRKKTLRNLHKHHQVTILELRWLRDSIKGLTVDGSGAVGQTTWEMFTRHAKETLWNEFKKEMNQEKFDQINKESMESRYQDQVFKLADFIQESIPGEPSRDEGAVDTIIRVVKLIHSEFGNVDQLREVFKAFSKTNAAWEAFLNNNDLTMDQFHRFRDHNPLGLGDTPMSTAQADAMDQHSLEPSPQQNVLESTKDVIQLVEKLGKEIGETKEHIDTLLQLVRDRDTLIEFLKTTAGWDFIDQSVETPIMAVIRLVKEQQDQIKKLHTLDWDQRFKIEGPDGSSVFEGAWTDVQEMAKKDGGKFLESIELLAKYVSAGGFGDVQIDPIQEVRKLVDFFAENQMMLNEADPKNEFSGETPAETAIRILRETWAG